LAELLDIRTEELAASSPDKGAGGWRGLDAADMAAVAEASNDLASWAEATNVGAATLAMLGEAPTHLAQSYLCDDPDTVFSQAARTRHRVITLLKGRQHPRQAGDLFMVAGQLSALLSWMAGDLGRGWEAWIHGRTALVCADLAGHDGTRALGLAALSKTAFWQGRHAEAAALAEQGRGLRPPGTLAVLLACQEADAHAERDDVYRVSAALDQVAEARHGLAPGEEIGGVLGCTVARQENYVAGVHLRLGDAGRAMEGADRALALLGGPSCTAYGTAAQVRITRALAMAAERDLDGVHDALAAVFALAPEHRLATIAARLRKVPSALPGGAGAGAVTIADQVEDFCRTVEAARIEAGHG